MESVKLSWVTNVSYLVMECENTFQKDFSFLNCQEIDLILQKGIEKALYDDKEGLFWLIDLSGDVAYEYYFKKATVKENEVDLKDFENFGKDFTIAEIKTEPKINYFLLPAISGSDIIKSFELSDIEFRHYYSKRQKEESAGTKSTDFGKLAHCCLLEPLKFEQKYIASKFDDFRTKEAKLWKEQIEKTDVEIVKEIDKNKASEMTKIIRNSLIKLLKNLDKAKTEIELNAVCELTGLQIKGKIDARLKTSDGSYILIDYKTTSELNNFERNYSEYKIYLKMAFYKYLMKLNNMNVSQVFLIVQSTQEPFDYEVFEVPEIDLIIGQKEFEEGIERIKNILSSEETEKEIKTIEMNSYTKRRLLQKYEITDVYNG